MWTKAFWKSVFERAFFSFFNTIIALPIMDGLDVLKLDWRQMAGAAGGAAVISLIKSIVVAGGTDGNPSALGSEVVATPGQTADPVGEDKVEVKEADDVPMPADTNPAQPELPNLS